MRSLGTLGGALLLGSAVAWTSCGDDGVTRPTYELGGGEGSAAASDGTYDFVAHHPYAETWQELDGLGLGYWDARPQLTAGWSYPNTGADPGIWADGREAEVTFLLREVAPRRLRFGLRQYWDDEGENEVIDVTLSLNGHELLTRELGFERQKIDVALPEEHQKAGLNLLTLAFPRTFTNETRNDAGEVIHTRRLTAWVENLVFEVEDGVVAREAARARALVRTGSRVSEVGHAIEQTTGSLLRHHLRVPPGARFKASALHPGDAPEALEFEVRVTPEGGEPRTLVSARAGAGQGEVVLEAPLDGLGGQVARFDFLVRAADGSGAAAMGVWDRPALVDGVGEEQVAPPADLAELRAALAGKPVVLFLLDAFNPDFMTAYGGREGLTPNLDRLASEGALFENAVAQASYTISSVASTLTSQYAWQHAAYEESTALSKSSRTWPERFAEAGYRTVGLVSSPNGSSRLGFDRGFETYRDVWREIRKKGEAKHTARVDDLLPILEDVLAVEDRRPPLLWMHIVEPHEPYHPPAPWSGSLGSTYAGSVTGDSDHLWRIRQFRLRPSPEELLHIKTEYEENLAYIDDGVRRILERLDREPAFEDAVVVVFSDHGEAFLEHERGKVYAAMGHGSTVYQEMSRIPLIVRLPDSVSELVPRGLRSEALVANFDIFPTVAELVGVPPIEGVPGTSFAGTLLDADHPARGFALSHTHTMHGERFLPGLGLWEDGWKYVYTSGELDELYDLEADPDERHNLADERPVRAGFMRQRLKEHTRFPVDGFQLEQVAAENLNPEDIATLKALGYLQGGSDDEPTDEPETERSPDPKASG